MNPMSYDPRHDIFEIKETLGRIEADFKHSNNIQTQHSEAIWDKDGRPGMATRLDRIEQQQKTNMRLISGSFGIIGLIGVQKLLAVLHVIAN